MLASVLRDSGLDLSANLDIKEAFSSLNIDTLISN